MSPRWLSSRQSAWAGAASDKVSGNGTLIGIAAVVFLLGSLVGYAVAGTGDGGGGGSSAAAKADVIDPVEISLGAIKAGAKTPKGAVKVATSLVTGLPNLALQPPAPQQDAISKILVDKPDPVLLAQLRDLLTRQAAQLKKPNVPVTAEVFIAPVTYKVVMQDDARAVVTLWFMTVLADSNQQRFESIWTTDTITLVYDEYWRVASFKTQEGPTPPLLATAARFSSYLEAQPTLDKSVRYRYATNR